MSNHYHIVMLELIESQNIDKLVFFISVRTGIILVCWFFMLLSSIIDFWSGTTTAKALGRPIMSHGIRKTVTKIGDYAKLMLFALMFDILGSLFSFYIMPFATVLFSISVMCIEGKSVAENSRLKRAHAGEIPDMVRKIIQATTTEEGKEIMHNLLTLKNEGDK